MRFNYQFLTEYCSENKIQLIAEYKDLTINRDIYIKGNCISPNCCNQFNKRFRQLVLTGGYCTDCLIPISNKKIKDALVECDVTMLLDFCNKNNIILLDDYSTTFVNRNTVIKGCCLQKDCKNTFIKSFRELLKINGYCKNCSKENGKIKIVETNLERYGVEYFLQIPEVRQQIIVTNLKKYGCENVGQSQQCKDKSKATNLERYGVEYSLQNPEVRQKIIATNLEKYGCENPRQNKEIKQKIINTNLEKYGVEYYLETPEFKQKVIQTNLDKYGVPHHSQNSEVANNMLKNAYNNKKYKMPSGNIIDYQGYENFALNELLCVEQISESDIITSRTNVPEIWYTDKNNKKRRHYVDFYIKSQNRCIEVKSTWTNQEKNNVFEKQIAAKMLGFKYDIWIYDKNGTKLQTFI
jgi:hypothetical protein